MTEIYWLRFGLFGDGPEFTGLFDSEEKAKAACDHIDDFIAPAQLNVKLPQEPIPWPGGYYPLHPAKQE